MIRWLIVALSFAIAPLAAAAEIADVRTLADLLAVAPVEAAGGYKVRMGMSDVGLAAGPVVVLYCWVEPSTRAATRPTTREAYNGVAEALGPLHYEIVRPMDDRIDRIRQLSQVQQAIGSSLYAASVLLEPLGPYKVVVRDRDGTLIGERQLPAEKRPPHVWYSFARAVYRQDAEPTAVVDDEPLAAVVRLDGSISRSRVGISTSTQPTRLFHIEDDLAARSPLSLAMEGDAFSLKLAGRKLIDRPHELLLARWWVNGKPVVKRPRLTRAKAMQEARQLRECDEIRVAFGLPDFLGDLKPNDRVALQVLYSPDDWNAVPFADEVRMVLQTRRLSSSNSPAWPIISNRIEFALTEEMLNELDHPIESK